VKIRYQLKPRSQRRSTPFRPKGVLSFGQLRTDHMFLMEHVDGKWVDPRIVPYGPLSLAPGAVVLHYAQEIFEGAKAFLHPDGEIYAFRIDKNAARMNRSAAGVCMQAVPEADQLEAILALLDVERCRTGGRLAPSGPSCCDPGLPGRKPQPYLCCVFSRRRPYFRPVPGR
jgi:branched-chain amino acid aminotransferase